MSGEKQGDRETMDSLIRDQVRSGVRPEKAEQKAREAMREMDRRRAEKERR